MFPVLTLTESAKAVAQSDPHGWILTAIGVTVVFLSLIFLYLLFALSGSIASGQLQQRREQRRAARKTDERTRADEQTAAAIALALHLYAQDAVHDAESGRITIDPTPSPWADKASLLRKSPCR